uniref:NADH dehydrogenase subunit 4L n=1 Tax=Cacopsylla melanoneura TaxID=428564 RepID=A0A8D8T711_9HEMI
MFVPFKFAVLARIFTFFFHVVSPNEIGLFSLALPNLLIKSTSLGCTLTSSFSSKSFRTFASSVAEFSSISCSRLKMMRFRFFSSLSSLYVFLSTFFSIACILDFTLITSSDSGFNFWSIFVLIFSVSVCISELFTSILVFISVILVFIASMNWSSFSSIVIFRGLFYYDNNIF